MEKWRKYIAVLAAAVMFSAVPFSAMAEETPDSPAVNVADDDNGSEISSGEDIQPSTDPWEAFASTGDGTEGSPYLISNFETLELFRDIVNQGNSGSGKYFRMTGDIEMSSGDWEPIGAAEINSAGDGVDIDASIAFDGIFDGGGKTISGLVINSSASDYQGLFGYNTGTVQKLTVSGTISGGSYVGGIVGYNSGTVYNCTNGAAVSGSGKNIGGIVGYNYAANVTGCTNKATVTCTNADTEAEQYVGGVVGYNQASDSSNATITNCTNEAEVSANGNEIGGIVGYNNGLIDKCSSTDSSDVTGRDRVGGIVGKNSKDSPGGTVQYCSNAGKVTSTGEGVNNGSAGGIAGDNGYKMEYCYNIGSIEGNCNVGGVVGFISENDGIKGEIYSCCNYNGTVKGNTGVGGVVGVNKGITSKCFNTGDIEGADRVGGVVGDNSIGDNPGGGEVINCYNTGAIIGKTCVGGVAGYNNNKGTNKNGIRFGTLKYCYNYGAVSGDEYVGGVVGRTLGEKGNEDCAKVIRCFYLDTCGVEIGIGDKPDSPDAVSLTAEQFDDMETFVKAGWDIVSETKTDPGTVWVMRSVLRRPIFFDTNAQSDKDLSDNDNTGDDEGGDDEGGDDDTGDGDGDDNTGDGDGDDDTGDDDGDDTGDGDDDGNTGNDDNDDDTDNAGRPGKIPSTPPVVSGNNLPTAGAGSSSADADNAVEDISSAHGIYETGELIAPHVQIWMIIPIGIVLFILIKRFKTSK